MRELTCIVCPRGCRLQVDEKTLQVTGNACPRGIPYAQSELTDPRRTLCTTVRTDSKEYPRLPVKTATTIPKDQLMAAMAVINELTVKLPVKMGDVLIADLLGTGAALVATRSLG